MSLMKAPRCRGQQSFSGVKCEGKVKGGSVSLKKMGKVIKNPGSGSKGLVKGTKGYGRKG